MIKATQIINHLGEADAVIEIAVDSLEEGASMPMQAAIATVLRGTGKRLSALAAELDRLRLEQERAQGSAELTISDEIEGLERRLAEIKEALA